MPFVDFLQELSALYFCKKGCIGFYNTLFTRFRAARTPGRANQDNRKEREMKHFNFGADIVRRFLMAGLVLGGALSLAACGGGGGGGGGGISTITGGEPVTMAQMSKGANENGSVTGSDASAVAAEVGPSTSNSVTTDMAGSSGVELYEGLYLKTGSLTVLDGGDPL
ncbi:MAG: hypothetical protein LBM64_03415, partial [Deltaproteobacteria bacterium]|nr:hypothetical protein [Deltaproteobacteria bacterium]